MNKFKTIEVKIVLVGVFLLPFIIISFFNQPCMDDYWSGDIINHYGRLGQVKYFALHINGRFFSNLLMGLVNTLPQNKFWIFNIMPIIIIVLFALTFFFLYKSILPEEKSGNIFFISVLLVVLHILNMRTLFEGLYWTFAALTYQIAILLMMVVIASMVRYAKQKSTFYLIIAALCSCILPGATETIEPLFLVFLCIITVLCIHQKKSYRLFIFCICANVIGTAIVVFSPGNYSRIAFNSIQYKSNIFLAAWYSVCSIGYYICLWLVTPANLIAFLILIPYLKKVADKTKAYSFLKKINPLLFLSFGLLACCLIYFPEHFFESELPYPRITTIFFFAFIHIFMFAIMLFFLRQSDDNYVSRLVAFSKKNSNYIFLIFLAAIFTSVNIRKVTKDLVTNTAYNYAIESKQRYQTLRNCKADTCYVARHKYWASSIENFAQEDLNTNPFVHIKDFFNKTILYKDSASNLKRQ